MTVPPEEPDGLLEPDELRRRLELERRERVRLQRKIDRLGKALARVEQSESYRIGHAVVRALTAPRALLRRSLFPRRKRSGRIEPAASAPLAPAAPAASANDVPRLEVALGPDWFGPANDGHATTLIVAWGHSPGELDALVDGVATLQMMQRHFKPLFLTDCAEVAAFQRYGYVFEALPALEEWAAHRPREEWRDYVDTRIARLIATYRPTRTLVYDSECKALSHGVLDRLVGPATAIGNADRKASGSSAVSVAGGGARQ